MVRGSRQFDIGLSELGISLSKSMSCCSSLKDLNHRDHHSRQSEGEGEEADDGFKSGGSRLDWCGSSRGYCVVHGRVGGCMWGWRRYRVTAGGGRFASASRKPATQQWIDRQEDDVSRELREKRVVPSPLWRDIWFSFKQSSCRVDFVTCRQATNGHVGGACSKTPIVYRLTKSRGSAAFVCHTLTTICATLLGRRNLTGVNRACSRLRVHGPISLFVCPVPGCWTTGRHCS
jgi:hypothetical protein